MKRVFVLLLVLFTNSLYAGEYFSGESIYIEKETSGDIYAIGSYVKNTVPVRGDLYAGGSTVIVSSSVGSDLVTGGGSVFVESPVLDDLRAVGGSVTLKENVGDDAFLIGGTADVFSNVQVKGDLMIAAGKIQERGHVGGKTYLAGGDIFVEGEMDGALRIAGDKVHINGIVSGDAKISATNGITIGPNAVFHGKVNYWTASGKADFGQSVQSGSAVYDPSLAIEDAGKNNGASIVFWILLFLSGIVNIGVLIYFFPGFFEQTSRWLYNNPLNGAGMGFLFVLIVPTAILILLITVIGLPLAIFLGTIYFLTLFFSLSMASLMYAFMIRDYRKKEWSKRTVYLVSLGVYLLLCILGSIPVLGWLINTILIVSAIGALFMYTVRSYRSATLPQIE